MPFSRSIPQKNKSFQNWSKIGKGGLQLMLITHGMTRVTRDTCTCLAIALQKKTKSCITSPTRVAMCKIQHACILVDHVLIVWDELHNLQHSKIIRVVVQGIGHQELLVRFFTLF